MKNRMIGIIGAVDQNGIYSIDDEGPSDKLPWGNGLGKTHLKWDAERFALLTKRTAPAGKVNTVVVAYGTARVMGMYPFKGRRLIVLANRLATGTINKDRAEDSKIYTAQNAEQAISLALSWRDGGHIFFAGGAPGLWWDALGTGLCTCAFVTVVQCDAPAVSAFKGRPLESRELLRDETFVNMKRIETAAVDDMWEDIPVELEFRNYKKV